MLVKRTVPSASAIWTPRRSFWSVMPSEYSEYPPSRSQCHTYTATPAQRAPSLARSEMTSSSSMETPSAVPLASPKLERMSLRTMPLCSSTSGQFEPSPG